MIHRLTPQCFITAAVLRPPLLVSCNTDKMYIEIECTDYHIHKILTNLRNNDVQNNIVICLISSLTIILRLKRVRSFHSSKTLLRQHNSVRQRC